MPGVEEEVEEVWPPLVDRDTPVAILPSILKMLVEKRKQVKNVIKQETDRSKL